MPLLTRIFNYEYLSKDQLAGFDKYKYSCVDNSPLSRYVMHPFWDQMVKIYPKWLAPNLITFTGFMCLIVQWVLFTIYDSHFYGYCFDQVDCSPDNEANLSARKLFFHANIDKFDYEVPANVCSCIPHWLWLVLAITQFLSHHLDGTDGKQARRTGSSSPLGELFDHGLDSWATLFLPVALFSIFGRSDPYGIPTIQMYGFLWVILVSFIISHWEKYNTGILFLPWSYDLSQLGMTFLFFMTYLHGQSVWYFKVFGITFTQVVVILVYTCAIGLSVPFTIYNMYKAFANKTMKQSSLYEAIRPILSTIYLFILQLVWIKYSSIEILQLEPRVFFWLTGTLFSNISCRLIVAQMTSTRCEIFNWCLIPLTLVVTAFSFKPLPSESPLGALLTSQAEVNALYFMAFLVTISHIHYGICMVRQICKHLNIYCFTITSKPAKSEEKTNLMLNDDDDDDDENEMVNPYALNSRPQPKSQVNLSQSLALKKFEKFESKFTSSLEKRDKKPSRTFTLDSSDDEEKAGKNSDDDDDSSDDSIFKNLRKSSNKFIKSKKKDSARMTPEAVAASKSPRPASRQQQRRSNVEEAAVVDEESEEEESEDEEEIEISAASRTPTPRQQPPRRSQSSQQQTPRAPSVASSVSSMQTIDEKPKRSPSRVKFIADEIDEEEASLVEDLLSRNLVLSIEDLETDNAAASINKFIKDRKTSILAGRRSESAASVKEEDEYSSMTPSPRGFEQPKLVLDIEDLERSGEEAFRPSSSRLAVPKKSKEKKDGRKSPKARRQEKSGEESSIVTEIEAMSPRKQPKKAKQTSLSEIKTDRSRRSYQDDFATSADESTTTITSKTTSRTTDYSDSKKSMSKRRKSRGKKDSKTTNIEVQVDPTDLLKYSDVLKSVNVYNPASLMLSSLSHFQDTATLRDLNQVTGYNLINETFNDLIKMNLNFMRGFLATQRSLYEQQLQSVQPK